jgi:hypothetical protein
MDYLQKHKDTLIPEFRQVWEKAGSKTSGTWEEVFGKGPGKADEIFMGWNYSSYINKVAEAGKKEYPIPMFVNAWIVQPEDKGPGDYPSGGPQDHMHDIWRAGAPALDMLCPDVYLPNFNELVDRYSRSGNPLYIPESAGDLRGAGNLFYAIGQRHAIGYSQFGIDSIARASAGPNPARPGAAQQEVEAMPLSVAYDMLGQLAPLILEHQSKDTIASVVVNPKNPDQQIKLGNYTLNVGLPRNRRNPTAIPDTTGYGIFMLTGPDEYIMAGNNVQVTFTPDGPGFASIARQEAGHFVNGKWVLTRYLAGDDSLLRYDLGAAADAGLSGTGVRLSPGERGIQKVRVYRYR